MLLTRRAKVIRQNNQVGYFLGRCHTVRNFSSKKEEDEDKFDDNRLETEATEPESEEEEEEYDEMIPEIKDCFYETLGVGRDANKQEVRDAYLSKAREFHPDKRPECLDYFTHVTKAYEVLHNDHKRAIYDDESIPDEDYFTLQVGATKINLFTVAMGVSMVGMAYVAYVQYFGAVRAA